MICTKKKKKEGKPVGKSTPTQAHACVGIPFKLTHQNG